MYEKVHTRRAQSYFRYPEFSSGWVPTVTTPVSHELVFVPYPNQTLKTDFSKTTR